jgi:hypothetical protein
VVSPQPRDELFQAERLRHVVVGASSETRDPFGDGVARGEEQHRRVAGPGPDVFEDLQSIQVGQHDVEHDDVGLDRRELGDGLFAVVRHVDRPTLVAHRHRDEVGERPFVVDEQDADG